MSDTHPGVEDEVERALRLGLATAAQLADRVTRARQELARDAQRRSDDKGRQLEARFRAEGASAAARLSVVERPDWWHHASPQQIVSMYELAHQWRDDQPHAANAADTIAQQVQNRYGIDVTTPEVDAEELRVALACVDIDGAAVNTFAAAGERTDDLATAVVAVVRADHRDAALGAAAASEERLSRGHGAEETYVESLAMGDSTESAPAYDTFKRRDAAAAQMRAVGLSEERIDVAMRADVAHARPATDAVTAAHSDPHAKVRRSADRGPHLPNRSR